MAENMTDEQILTDYYNTVYGSEAYKKMSSADYLCKMQSKLLPSAEKSIKNRLVFLLFVIYLSIVIVLITGIFFAPLIIIVPVIMLCKSIKSYKFYMNQIEISRKQYDISSSEVIKIKSETPKPPLPQDKLNEASIKTLLEIFASKRADTFKEAFIIYEQDRQYEKLVAEQRAARQAAIDAQNEALRARNEAAAAKREAEYQRREAEYWREEEYYSRNR